MNRTRAAAVGDSRRPFFRVINFVMDSLAGPAEAFSLHTAGRTQGLLDAA